MFAKAWSKVSGSIPFLSTLHTGIAQLVERFFNREKVARQYYLPVDNLAKKGYVFAEVDGIKTLLAPEEYELSTN